MKKNKVLIIVENLPVPFDPRVWKEAIALKENGYEVTVLCPRSSEYRRGYDLIEGIHVYRHPMPRIRDGVLGYLCEYSFALFWQFLYVCWIYFRRRFHVIQGCNPPDDIFLVALPYKVLGVKYIFDHHDANPELYLSKFAKKDTLYKVLKILERLTYFFSDVAIVTNRSYRDLAINRGGMAPENVFVVRNGPDARTFRAVAPNPLLKYGKSYLVGYVGNMDTQDGLDILLDAASHIKGLGRSDVHFTCIGNGPDLARLRQMTEEKQLQHMVNFTGRIPDAQLLQILSTADICVNPDRPCEMNDISTMIKVMEYMALGKPIVQFDLKEGKFSAQDASLYADNQMGARDFAAKILTLLECGDTRKKMGEFGRKRIEDVLAWDHSIENLIAAYQKAFCKRGRSPQTPRSKRPVEVKAPS